MKCAQLPRSNLEYNWKLKCHYSALKILFFSKDDAGKDDDDDEDIINTY
jgi:hypothetical protein